MNVSQVDRAWMLRALAEAERGKGAVEPNPMVGAVLVRDNFCLATGHHEEFGGPHAEILALNRAGQTAQGATLYVTLEPCCHHGKTPPCVDALIAAKIGRVVIAVKDPFPKVDGGGIARLREAGIPVEIGLEREASSRLNAPYLKRLTTGKPFVLAKWAMTLDGKIATASGSSSWISSPRSRVMVHELRGRMDAIVVGIGTVLHDNPQLTARPAGQRVPLRVVLDSEARLPIDSLLVRTIHEAPILVVVSARAIPSRVEALKDAGCELIEISEGSGGLSVDELLEILGRRGATNVLVEGGSKVLGTFLEARQIDEVDVFIAPKIEGGRYSSSPISGPGAATMADALRLVRPEITIIDGDVRFRGMMPWCSDRVQESDSS